MRITRISTLRRLILLISVSLADNVAAAVPEVALATDPSAAFGCLMQPVGTLMLSDATTSTTRMSGGGAYLYQSGFNAATWSGSLKKLKLTFGDDSGAARTASIVDWDAADILTGIQSVPPIPAKPDADARHIYTAKIAADKSLVTIPFFWDDLSAQQKVWLNASPIDGTDDRLGEKRLDYLRGGRRYEQGRAEGIFRPRERLLGAVVHGAPLFVGAPSSGLQGSDYPAFYDANKARRPAVYLGANDGMLHAFDAVNGEELFAYIPYALFDRLGQLTLPDDAHRAQHVHRTYVDGAIAVAEARAGNRWRTVLVSGMGGGAQGVFALDVTAPDKFEQGSGALWEFTDADDADIGHVMGAPAIAKFKVGIVKGVPTYRYFAVVSSGLNNYRDDGAGKFNAGATNALFLLSLDKARSEKWIVGVNYFKFITPISDKTLANGLAAPALTLAGDGAVSYAYAGDLQGNLWRFNFNGNAPWSTALGGAPIKPLFTAMDAEKNRQPITQKVNVVFAPVSGYLVLFGTGKFLEHSDLERRDFKKQSFYGILDRLTDNVAGRSQLMERKLAAGTANNSKALEISDNYFKYGTAGAGEKGWYFDFIDADRTGERSVSAAQIVDGKLFFNSLIPDIDPCRKSGGRSYVLDALTGLPAYANVTGYLSSADLPNSPVILETFPGEAAERDATGKRRVRKKIETLDADHDPADDGTKEAAAPLKKQRLNPSPRPAALAGVKSSTGSNCAHHSKRIRTKELGRHHAEQG